MDLIVSTSALLFTELISQHICIHVTMPTSEMRRTTTSLSTPFWEFRWNYDDGERDDEVRSLSTPFWEFPFNSIPKLKNLAIWRNIFLLPFGSFGSLWIETCFSSTGLTLSTPFWEFHGSNIHVVWMLIGRHSFYSLLGVSTHTSTLLVS